LRGYTGEHLNRKVTIIPLEKYPFKILKIRAKNGKDIRFQLQEEKSEKGLQYTLTVENQRLQKGRYSVCFLIPKKPIGPITIIS
jgi:C-terminal processing protease CtpA/Prc